ncbi:MAG: YvcK family protein [Parcubacteria group bacterium]|nr:YvcK family protein [Parcubacteria group bacterium]
MKAIMVNEPAAKKKIVFIGGGAGVRNLAPALKDDYDFTAILSSFDNGGSYGRLRGPYHTPLSGDVRSALAALSTNEIGKLSEYRFERGDVAGHAFGNLLLTAVYAMAEDPAQAMAQLHRLYGAQGAVLPVSYTYADLHAELMDRTILRGEEAIDEPHAKSQVRIRRVWLDPDAVIARGVAEAIAAADLIIMGPGDIYTSLVPNLLVEGVSQAVMRSPAKKVYFCNAFTKYGQTNGFNAFDHVRAVEQYLKPNTFQTVVLNTSPISETMERELKKRREDVVRHDVETLEKSGYAVLRADLLDGREYEQAAADAKRRSSVRYDAEKVKKTIALCV